VSRAGEESPKIKAGKGLEELYRLAEGSPGQKRIGIKLSHPLRADCAQLY